MTLGQTVARLRDQRGWSQGQLAMKAGMMPTQISRIERDVHQTINARNLARLAEALEVSADHILVDVGWLTPTVSLMTTPTLAEQHLLKTIRSIQSESIRSKLIDQLAWIAQTVFDAEVCNGIRSGLQIAAEEQEDYQAKEE